MRRLRCKRAACALPGKRLRKARALLFYGVAVGVTSAYAQAPQRVAAARRLFFNACSTR